MCLICYFDSNLNQHSTLKKNYISDPVDSFRLEFEPLAFRPIDPATQSSALRLVGPKTQILLHPFDPKLIQSLVHLIMLLIRSSFYYSTP